MFGLILPSRPVLGPPALQTISPTQFAYTFPVAPSFSHIVVFLLPENTLPPDTLAGIYVQFPPSDPSIQPEFKLLGAISAEKQTAIFRVTSPRNTTNAAEAKVVGEVGGVAEVDMDADESGGGANGVGAGAVEGSVTVGISVEPASALQPQLAALLQQNSTSAGTDGTTARAPASSQLQSTAPSTKVLAQRIIKNAFNFLASFAGGDEKVPLKSFEEWWKKFERRVEADPGFLERDDS